MKNRSEKIMEPVRPDSTQIAALAYELWQARGCPEGSPEIDWQSAEAQLMENQTIHDLMAA